MSAPTQRVRCITPTCTQYGVEHTVTATAVGPFWSWPPLRCVCDAEPANLDSFDSLDDIPRVVADGARRGR